LPYTKIASVNDVALGTMKKFMIGQKEYLVVNLGGKFYTIDDRCTHMQGDLSLGILEGNVVTCPRHGSQFDVTTGKSLRGPKIVVRMRTGNTKAYDTKIEGSDVMVDI